MNRFFGEDASVSQVTTVIETLAEFVGSFGTAKQKFSTKRKRVITASATSTTTAKQPKYEYSLVDTVLPRQYS